MKQYCVTMLYAAERLLSRKRTTNPSGLPDLPPFLSGTQFACFAGTKGQILTLCPHLLLLPLDLPPFLLARQFACFTGTKVQILTLCQRAPHLLLLPLDLPPFLLARPIIFAIGHDEEVD